MIEMVPKSTISLNSLANNATTLGDAEYVYAANIGIGSGKQKYIWITSSDWVKPSSNCKVNGAVTNSTTVTIDAKSSDFPSSGTLYLFTDPAVSPITATVSSNTMTTSSNVSFADNERIYVSTTESAGAGRIYASFLLPAGASIIFAKSKDQKVFATQGAKWTSGSTPAGVSFTKVGIARKKIRT